MNVTYFRPRKLGPESCLEDAVANRIPQLFPETCWTAGSLPLGAGIPDLVIVQCEPAVYALANVPLLNAQILAYLRAVGRARVGTIASRIGCPERIIIRNLDNLVQAQAVSTEANAYRLAPQWREILPEIVTVEVKVANWRRAVDQAGRNSIFAHRSFVALPQQAALRVQCEAILQQTGVGLLGVGEDNEVRIIRRPVRRQPRVWSYYYQVALFAAKNLRGSDYALRCADRNGSDQLPGVHVRCSANAE